MTDPESEDTRSLLPDPRRGFEGKVALITGASRGIGRALALRLAARGTTTIVNYKQNEQLALEVVAEVERLGATGMAIRADLESLEEIEAMFDQVQERFGRLDFFVSNASASNFHHFMDLKPHHLERTFNLNVRAFVVGTQRAVRLMRDGGRIVVLSSYGSIRTFPTYANLGSAKAAIETWARYMAVELAPRGVNVNAVNGGIIETDSSSYFYATGRVPSLETVVPKIPKKRLGTAAEVAECCLFLLSPGAEYVTGTTLLVDGGLTAISPPFHADMAAESGALDALSEALRT
jgi:enoyl-[acyl-carrier protein] reductase III